MLDQRKHVLSTNKPESREKITDNRELLRNSRFWLNSLTFCLQIEMKMAERWVGSTSHTQCLYFATTTIKIFLAFEFRKQLTISSRQLSARSSQRKVLVFVCFFYLRLYELRKAMKFWLWRHFRRNFFLLSIPAQDSKLECSVVNFPVFPFISFDFKTCFADVATKLFTFAAALLYELSISIHNFVQTDVSQFARHLNSIW